MNPTSMTGAFIITLSLLFYGIGSISLQRFKMVSIGVLWFLSTGVFLDIVASIFMIVGSQNTPFSLHGFIGFSALLGMLTDLILLWKFYSRNSNYTIVRKPLLRFSKLAYGWWIVAYLTGSLLIMWR